MQIQWSNREINVFIKKLLFTHFYSFLTSERCRYFKIFSFFFRKCTFDYNLTLLCYMFVCVCVWMSLWDDVRVYEHVGAGWLERSGRMAEEGDEAWWVEWIRSSAFNPMGWQRVGLVGCIGLTAMAEEQLLSIPARPEMIAIPARPEVLAIREQLGQHKLSERLRAGWSLWLLAEWLWLQLAAERWSSVWVAHAAH
jgi:hypothetical protein